MQAVVALLLIFFYIAADKEYLMKILSICKFSIASAILSEILFKMANISRSCEIEEPQLSQNDCVTLRLIEYFVNSLEII